MDELDKDILRRLLKRVTLNDIIATLAALCYEKATEVRESVGPEKARIWVKAANYLMGTSVNTNITEV